MLVDTQSSVQRGWLSRRIYSIWYGAALPWTALKLILRRPSLLLWSILPSLITLILYIFIAVKIEMLVEGLMSPLLSKAGADSSEWIRTLFSFFLHLILFVLSAVSFSMVATLVACPFNDFLAERAESFAEPPLPKVPFSSLRWRARLIALDMEKTLAAVVGSLLTLFLALIPVINIVGLFLTFLLICFQFTSFPQSRRGEGVTAGIHFMLKHVFSCVGFGAALTILFAIPFFAWFVLPLAVVGGTLLVARAQSSDPLLKIY